MRKDELKKAARGKPCMVRIAAECGFNHCAGTDTTVLAHITMPGLKGVGMKVPDLLGAWACDTCHGILDGRYVPRGMVQKSQLKLWHHEGVARTIDQLIKDGVIES